MGVCRDLWYGFGTWATVGDPVVRENSHEGELGASRFRIKPNRTLFQTLRGIDSGQSMGHFCIRF